MRLLSLAVEVTNSLSNLLKAGLVKSEETRIIDYNSIITEKLEEIRKKLAQEGLTEVQGAGEFVEGLAVQEIELEPQPDPQEELEKARAEAEELLAKARAEAEQIKAQAQTEAEALCEQACEKGMQEGYAQGSQKAQVELAKLQKQLADEEDRRQQEYMEKLRQMEPELVDVILEVVSKVICVGVQDKRDIVLHLVENAIEHVESSKQFLIHVSKEDYSFLIEQKEALLEQLPQNTELDIIKDVTLTQTQCLIETDGGIFDCSLDTKLGGLIADMKALSMQ